MGNEVAILLSLISGVIAGIASITVWAKTARAIRAKNRLHNLLIREAKNDPSVVALLRAMSSINGVSDAELEQLVTALEQKMTNLPKEDQGLIEEGLRQRSRRGVSQYLREVAA